MSKEMFWSRGAAVALILAAVLQCAFFSSQASTLLINEVSIHNTTFPDENGEYHPWIEIANIDSTAIDLSDWILAAYDHSPYRLPPITIPRGGHVIIWLSNNASVVSDSSIHAPLSIDHTTRYVAIYKTTSLAVTDVTNLKFMAGSTEVLTRFPEGSKSLYYYPERFSTPFFQNRYPGAWRKVSPAAQYSPRDSAPNACLVFNNAVWILTGWDAASGFHSSSNVWRSFDGVNFSQVVQEAPYPPYSGFVVFKGRMWAFSDEAYYSFDGEEWNRVEAKMPFPDYSEQLDGVRVQVFKDSLWAFFEDKIWVSADGINWLLKASAPWQPRYNPRVLVFKDKLWFIGGGRYYNTGYDEYFTDVWNSDNGTDWSLVTDSAAWKGRYWFSCQVFNNKLVFTGGWNWYERNNSFYGNLNDFWYSDDGKSWNEVHFDNVWEPRHAAFSYIFKNTLYISSGYGSFPGRLYNDIWRLSVPDEAPTYFLTKLTYGDPGVRQLVYSHNQYPLQLRSLDPEKLRIEGTVFSPLKAGLCHVEITQPGDGLFTNTVKKVLEIEISKKSVTVEVLDATREFGEENPPFQMLYSGFTSMNKPKDTDALVEFETEATVNSAVGEYTVTPRIIWDKENYDYTIRAGRLTITPGSKEKYLIYPNPASDRVTIALENDYSYIVTLFDSMGKVVSTFRDVDSSFDLSLSNVAQGLYFLEIKGAGISLRRRLIISR